jgi:predicted RNA-binding Zn ribbon-like protein
MELNLEPDQLGSKPAPGSLALVQAFINTADVEAGTDSLPSTADLERWLRARGLPVGEEPLVPGDLERAVAVREALRAMVLANNGEALDPDAVATLNRAAARAAINVRFDPEGRAQLAPSGQGVDAALGVILAAVQAAEADGTWKRLKACRNHGCTWAFYDGSKNRSGAWCTMDVCGNLMKARAYRRRRARSRATP